MWRATFNSPELVNAQKELEGSLPEKTLKLDFPGNHIQLAAKEKLGLVEIKQLRSDRNIENQGKKIIGAVFWM